MYLLSDIPRKWTKLSPKKECVTCRCYEPITQLTWSEFNERINKLGNSFLKLGLKKGDHVAILSENCHRYFELYYAMFKTGIVPVPLNFRLALGELESIVNRSEATGIIVGPEEIFLERAKLLNQRIQRLKFFITFNKETEEFMLYEDLINEGESDEPDVEINEDDLAILLSTSGTTGTPKICMLTHRSLMTEFTDLIISTFTKTKMGTTRLGFGPDDTALYVHPFFHIAFWSAFVPHILGQRVVIIKRPHPKEILEAIEKEKVSWMNALSTMYYRLLTYPQLEKHDLSSVKTFIYAGAPFPTETLKQCMKKFGSHILWSSGLGATEGGPWTLIGPEHFIFEEGKEIPKGVKGSVGTESLLCRVRIVNEQGRDVNPGEVGEIIVKSKSTMKGYWKDSEKTAEAIKNGWYYTGDLATMDEDGYVYLKDRKKDRIKTGGENVYSFEVEDTLCKHDAVAEAGVVGVPHPEWIEIVKAVIYVKPEYRRKYEGKQEELKDELIKFCHDHIAGYKCPKVIEFSDEPLPKTSAGKILRRRLKDLQ